MTVEIGRKKLEDSANTVARVEEALGGGAAAGSEAAAAPVEPESLHRVLRDLQQHVASLEAHVAGQKESSDQRAGELEARLAAQGERLERLGAGREKSMLELRRLEQELRLVQAERDALRRELERVEAVQTETVAYDEDSDAGVYKSVSGLGALPSISELMNNLPAAAKPQPVEGFSCDSPGRDAGADEDAWQEMLPPDAMVSDPVAGGGRADADVSGGDPEEERDVARWRLIRSDTDVPKEYHLNGQLMTLGRSEMADIRIDGEFISRVHARLLTIDSELVVEDAGSKNGILVNGDKTRRRSIRHGDELVVGSVRFRVVDGGEL